MRGRWRTTMLTALAMVAFAANSVLNRAALADALIDPMAFAAIRLAAGAVTLGALATALRGRAWLTRLRPAGALALALYVTGFSAAYLRMDAGAGALILFGGVQVTMFAGALALGESVPARRWIGAALALAGLAWMLLPGAGSVPPVSAALMALAAFGWGLYSLMGRAGTDPLSATAAAFAGAVPLGLAAFWAAPAALPARPEGIALAVLSGAVTSGLGYALWYAVLPRLGPARAALAQLTVPVIAVAGGTLLLAEIPGPRLALACALVIGGVAFGLSGRRGAR
ncbi:transcriptional regulator, LysR family [Oceaniovalibus guishaninsula JLT2003]|uniref:Transcriptional regulator, LysR family n=2 Tax=Oceaniovalibus TaxID=1207070 RepID=K2HMU4_9RHOB|nr:transcriptional regulator, LysR family [Oceaniovalibus guishaninsula JLT2003]